ncbi:hypothetical protein SAMN05192529_102116 [Arachidicoccus rhizosphaerae]|uniref:Uncharacterized protein n=1 Tax=Arachidicoccus rhizosphaerae TaxID=551991 RepID=A0A1H3W431_9BACT|nr:hypothetical protein [Arachidicoccus rhizosphaerae]SDZ81843.1 hypothetical protein SAMN05192529_102116 [Arachidicoccus rhizosphaerae]
MTTKETLIEKIKEWQSIEGLKPVNDKGLIASFIDFMWPKDEKEFTDMWIEFNGDGSYFGKQLTMTEDARYVRPDPLLNFEISYSTEQISIYDGNHNGFWTPEYIKLKRGDDSFLQLREAIYKRIGDFTGLKLDFNITH